VRDIDEGTILVDNESGDSTVKSDALVVDSVVDVLVEGGTATGSVGSLLLKVSSKSRSIV